MYIFSESDANGYLQLKCNENKIVPNNDDEEKLILTVGMYVIIYCYHEFLIILFIYHN